MSDTEQHNLKQALEDVRAAYRLLYAYHKRVRGIIQTIEGEFNGEYKFWEWSPKRWNKPSRKLTSDNWTWDCFPFHSYSIWYSQTGDNETPRKGDILLHLVIDTDTGMPNVLYGDTDPQDFNIVDGEIPKSQLTFNVLRCEVEGNKKTWNGEDYYGVDWLNYPILQLHGFKLYSKSYDLCELYDIKQVQKELSPLFKILNPKQKQPFDETTTRLQNFIKKPITQLSNRNGGEEVCLSSICHNPILFTSTYKT